MSHGLPVVISDLPICKEILGDFGIYFGNGDAEKLAMRLEDATLIDWQAKSEEAFKIAKQYDVNHIILKWEQILEGDEQ